VVADAPVTGDAGPPPDVGDFCAQHHAGVTSDGDAVNVCDAVFPAAPFVRPPPDVVSTTTATTLYVAVSPLYLTTEPFAVNLFDRNGKQYVAVDDTGAPFIQPLDPNNAGVGPAGLRMLSNRGLFLIYRVAGALGTMTDSSGMPWTTIHITEAVPVIHLPGKTIDTVLQSTVFEGTVSKRISDGVWDMVNTTPIRISFSSMTHNTFVLLWANQGATWPDGETFNVNGTIENWAQNAKASDGTCMPSLMSLGQANPFFGAPNGDMNMFRIVEMHGSPGEREMVFTYPPTSGLTPTGMGENAATSIFYPSGLMMNAPVTKLSINPHSSPNGHQVNLQPVQGGGGGC
jgi:hypothetical protein